MMQVQELTKEEQMKLYMKLPKKKIAEMLYNCNLLLRIMPVQKTIDEYNQFKP